MFLDFKEKLGMEKGKARVIGRVRRLLLGLMLAYLILAMVGLFGLARDWVEKVISWGKGSFIWLRGSSSSGLKHHLKVCSPWPEPQPTNWACGRSQED